MRRSYIALRTSALAATAAAGMVFASCSPDSGEGGSTINMGVDEAGGSGNAGGSSGSGGDGTGATNFGGNFGSDDGGSTGGSTSGTGGAVADGGCATTNESAVQTPANLLFVIDKSGSMNCNLPEDVAQTPQECDNFPQKIDTALPSKWEVTRDALVTAFDDLEALGNVSVGVTLFPNNNSCGVSNSPDVPVALLDGTHKTALTTFLNGVTPDGSTPLVGATVLSYAYLVSTFGNRLQQENTFVVLVTDGSEQCSQSQVAQLLDTNAPDALSVNVRTFVIGAPGSEAARGTLSRLASQGGTESDPTCESSGAEPLVGAPCHFDMTTTQDFQTDFANALAEISQAKELSCEFELPDPNEVEWDPGKVNVSFTPGGGVAETVLADPDRDCETDADGWQYNDAQDKIVLCGPICDSVQTDRTGQVEIVLGCPTETVKLQ